MVSSSECSFIRSFIRCLNDYSTSDVFQIFQCISLPYMWIAVAVFFCTSLYSLVLDESTLQGIITLLHIVKLLRVSGKIIVFFLHYVLHWVMLETCNKLLFCAVRFHWLTSYIKLIKIRRSFACIMIRVPADGMRSSAVCRMRYETRSHLRWRQLCRKSHWRSCSPSTSENLVLFGILYRHHCTNRALFKCIGIENRICGIEIAPNSANK